MRSWLIAGILLLAAGAIPARAAAPVAQWSQGDWWEVQLEQTGAHFPVEAEGWSPTFRLHFRVTSRTGREVAVLVTTVPENRFKEQLRLRYSSQGELLSALVVDARHEEELGPAGGFGVFGMLGREAFVMAVAPATGSGGHGAGAHLQATGPVRLRVPGSTGSYQTWLPREPYWRQYEAGGTLWQRGTLVRGSWRRAASGVGSRQ
jgi:hypothetical protein